jgi:excisionase family DNA binding protein
MSVDRLSYTIPEVMAATGLGRSSLYRLMASGELPAIKVLGRTLVRASDLREFLDRAPSARAEITETETS